MPLGSVMNVFGSRQSPVEFLHIGPQQGGDETGSRPTPRGQTNRGRSGDYAASSDGSADAASSEEEGSSMQDASPGGGRRCRFDQPDMDSIGSKEPRKCHFEESRAEQDEGTGEHSGATGGGRRSGNRQSVFSDGQNSAESKYSSPLAPRKNSILDNRMQQLRNLRLELASIQHSAPRSRGWAQTKCGDLMNAAMDFRCSSFRRCARRVASRDFITTPLANTLCGGLIVLNAMFIGLEMEINDDTGFRVQWFLIESWFLAFFILELALRFRSATCKASLRDPWIIFDISMILPGVLDTWVLQFVYASTEGMPRLTLLRLVRLARVARVLRVIRLIRYFHELVLLARGILGAVQALSWSLVLIFMILYVSAVLTTSWYNYEARVDKEMLKTAHGIAFVEWFGSIGASLLTLFQLMTLEGWPEILRTSMEVWPQAWIFFVPFILLTNVSLLNAITAVVVEKVFSIAQNEAADEAKRAEKARLAALRKLKGLFSSIDVDHNATLDLEEFRKALKDPRVVAVLLELGIARYEADELFECLDLDGNEELSVAEFVDGCLRAVGPAQSKHLLQVQYDLLRNFKSLRNKISDLHSAVRVVLKQLTRVHGVNTVKKKHGKYLDSDKDKRKSGKDKERDRGRKDASDFTTSESRVSERPVRSSARKQTGDSTMSEAVRSVRKESIRNRSKEQVTFKDDAEGSDATHTEPQEVLPPHQPDSAHGISRGEPSLRPPSPRRNDSLTRRRPGSASSSREKTPTNAHAQTGAGRFSPRMQPSADGHVQPLANSLEQATHAVDTRQYKPVGSLLESASQEQQAISKVLHTLLEEMRDLHGHVSEAMALNWEGNREKSRTPHGIHGLPAMPAFFVDDQLDQAANAAPVSDSDDRGSAPE